jgi:glycosyltransferase involved in cell wall biosynthesis
LTYDVCAVVISDLAFDARVWREVRSLRDSGRMVKLIGCRFDCDRIERRSDSGVDVVEVPLGSRTGRVSVAARALTLTRVFTEVVRTRAHVYHTHNIHPALAALLASRLRRVPLVYDAHELYWEPWSDGPLARAAARARGTLEQLIVRRADAVITTNASRAAALGARYGRNGIGVLANVPALQLDVEPLDPGFPPGTRVLLYQGGIYAKSRAFKQTIAALSLLPDDVHFVLLGFGRALDLERVGEWARAYGVADRVHFLPPRPFDELVRTAALATVGLVPIRPLRLSHVLGDTNKIHEYLMAGLPVVASNLPEIRQIARDGDPPVGELFDPERPESIAAAVEAVIGDRSLLQRRRVEARRLARERYNWDIEQRALLDVYADLPARRPVPTGEVT